MEADSQSICWLKHRIATLAVSDFATVTHPVLRSPILWFNPSPQWDEDENWGGKVNLWVEIRTVKLLK